MAAICASRIPGPEIAAVVSCLEVGNGSSAPGAHPLHRLEAIGRTTTSSRRRAQQKRGLADDLAQLRFDAAELISSSRFSSQLPPCRERTA